MGAAPAAAASGASRASGWVGFASTSCDRHWLLAAIAKRKGKRRTHAKPVAGGRRAAMGAAVVAAVSAQPGGGDPANSASHDEREGVAAVRRRRRGQRGRVGRSVGAGK